MSSRPTLRLALAALIGACAASPALAQSASTSGAEAAETQPPASASTASPSPTGHSHSDRSASPQMRTSGAVTPSGPYTSTVQPDDNSLYGSSGASAMFSQPTPPPGRTPPNGSAPDTSSGAGVDNAQNAESGPH